eukprot:SAG31_NODE_612_length_13548_cov_171.183285_13_plen_190_part_00
MLKPPGAIDLKLTIATARARGTVSPYFRGFNIDMSAGASPGIPAHANREFFSINFADPHIIYMAKSLAATGAFLRIGGTGNDYVEYGGGIGEHICNATESHKNCLNATHMGGLCTLVRESGAKAVFGLAITARTFANKRDKIGRWDPTQARALIQFMQKRQCPPWGFELGVSPCVLVGAAWWKILFQIS